MCGRGGRSSVSTVCVGTMCALGESEAKNACEATGGKVLGKVLDGARAAAFGAL